MSHSLQVAFGKRSRVAGPVLLALLAFGLFSVVGSAAPDPANAKKRPKPTRVKLKVATGKQAAALSSKVVKVRVRTTGRAAIRLNGRHLKPRWVKFKRNRRGARVVRMAVTNPGWLALATCGAKPIKVVGRYKRVIRRKGKRNLRRNARAANQRRLGADRSICGQPPRCDPLDQAICLLPWPNDYYLKRDQSTETGLRLDLTDEMMPTNQSGKPIAAEAWNHSDGFSPGQPIVVKVPGLDNPDALTATDPVSIARIREYERPDTPIVLLEADTGERVPIWVELDSTAKADANRLLQIIPARNLKPKTRYIVAMRDLTTADGSLIPPGPEFKAYRDMTRVAGDPRGERRAHMESIFRDLRKFGVERGNLYLAWDFTVASDESLTSRLLSMRDRAFADLGDTDLADREVKGSAPAFEITGVTPYTVDQNPRIARVVRGTMTVPCYLWPSCEMQTGPTPGGVFELGADGLPQRNVEKPATAKFTCIVPRASEAAAARPSLYGHGLFSDLEEVTIRPHQNLAQDHNMVLCGTDQTGLTYAEQMHVVDLVSDFSRFPEITDGMQQGMLNELYLGRLMLHPQGLSSHEEFRVGRVPGGAPVIDTTGRLSYSGYSMGGIMGGMLTAVSPDLDRAVLGVPGARFSLLLPRSSYWNVFGPIIKNAYRSEIETPLVLSLLQTIWDRGEANGYVGRMTTDPLPNTPPHRVLLSTAFGDHQVTNWATDVMARSIDGVAVRAPVLDPGRWGGVDELWGIPRIAGWPHTGSAMTMWDIGPVREGAAGVPAPPLTNTPNLGGDDPHDMIWDMPGERASVSSFIGPNAGFSDPCPAGTPCYAGSWTGPGTP